VFPNFPARIIRKRQSADRRHCSFAAASPILCYYIRIVTLLSSRLLSAAVLIGAATIVVVFASPSYRQGEPSIAGTRAHDFPMQLDGKSEHLSDFRGKVVVLNFWASWCPPCIEEIASLNTLQSRIQQRGATILGVSIDEDPAAYERFLRQYKVIFPTFRDPTANIATTYGTKLWPETYIIGTDGRIARKIVGPQAWDSDELVNYILSLAPANPPTTSAVR
jgi:cytochrome c biogenesis protein CcmG, thiol:disulfide interchange protein DsbE